MPQNKITGPVTSPAIERKKFENKIAWNRGLHPIPVTTYLQAHYIIFTISLSSILTPAGGL